MLSRLIGTIMLSFALLCSFSLPGALAAPAAEAPKTLPAASVFAAMLEKAEKGEPHAMVLLGSLYEQGIGAPRNFTSAMQWYEKAASAGSAEGYSRLAACYEVGVGVTANMDTALKNYQKAVDMEFPVAQHKMGTFYLSGNGVSQDVSKGISLLSKAAEKWAPAGNDLAAIYLNGLFGQTVDQKKAFDLLTKSADQGHVESMKNLAVMYKDGIGRKADSASALRWYLIAQKGGYNAQDLPTVIDGLKKGLKPAQVKQAETDASKWVTDFQAKRQQQPK